MKLKKYKVYSIKWDTDGDREAKSELPKKIVVGIDFEECKDKDQQIIFDEIVSERITDEYGYCHEGFKCKFLGEEEGDEEYCEELI
jgi:hypothetical protein